MHPVPDSIFILKEGIRGIKMMKKRYLYSLSSIFNDFISTLVCYEHHFAVLIILVFIDVLDKKIDFHKMNGNHT